MPEDWMSAVIVPLYKGKRERISYRNYKGIRLLSGIEKIHAGILVDRVRRVTGSFNDDEQGGFRTGRGYVD